MKMTYFAMAELGRYQRMIGRVADLYVDYLANLSSNSYLVLPTELCLTPQQSVCLKLHRLHVRMQATRILASDTSSLILNALELMLSYSKCAKELVAYEANHLFPYYDK